MKELVARNNYAVLDMKETVNSKVGVIELSEPNQQTSRWGTVLSVGEGVQDFNGELVKPDVEVGQLAYVTAHGQHEVRTWTFDGDKDLTVASVLDILAVIKDMNTLSIQPLGAYIEIEKIEVEEEKMGILFVPDVQKYPPNVGRVKTVGLGWSTMAGTRIPFQVEVGDLVVYDPFAEMTLDLSQFGSDQKKYLVMAGQIIAVVKE